MKDWCYAFTAKLIGFFVARLPRPLTLIIGGRLGALIFWLAPAATGVDVSTVTVQLESAG